MPNLHSYAGRAMIAERIGVGPASADRVRFACCTSKGPIFSARNLPKELARNFKKYQELASGTCKKRFKLPCPADGVDVTCQQGIQKCQ